MVFLLALLWVYLGPGSDEHTIAKATIDSIERTGDQVRVVFLASTYPAECADPDRHSFDFVGFHRANSVSDKWISGMKGTLEVKIEAGVCSIMTFEPEH